MSNEEKLYKFCKALINELDVPRYNDEEVPTMKVYYYPTQSYVQGEVDPTVAALLYGIKNILVELEDEYES